MDKEQTSEEIREAKIARHKAHMEAKIAIIECLNNSVMDIIGITNDLAAHKKYLKGRRLFPDRKTPHRIVKRKKKQAKAAQAFAIARLCVSVATTAVRTSGLMALRPDPGYPKGGVELERHKFKGNITHMQNEQGEFIPQYFTFKTDKS